MNREALKEIYKENGLVDSDVFVMTLGGKDIPMVKREGIEKIQAKNKISVTFELMKCSDDNSHVVVKGVGTQGSIRIESFGEASAKNNKNQYPVAMAEKRALSRVVLKMCGMYALGIYGEDEIEK